MKEKITSLLRHAVTSLGGLGGLLVEKHLIDTTDVAVVNDAGVSLGNALAVIVGAVIARLALMACGKLFGSNAGNSGGTSGGSVLPLLMTLGTAAACLGLPSCSSLSDLPVTGSFFYRDPNSGAKAGLALTPGERPTAFVRVPVYDPQTGEKRGEARIEIPVAKAVTPATPPAVDTKSGK